MFGNNSDFDFNNAEARTGFGELIPEKTIVQLIASIRPGQSGPGGFLTMNKNGDAMYLDMEFTVVGGPYDRRKVWERFTVEVDPERATEGQRTAQGIARSTVRAMVESARGIRSTADDETSMQARRIGGWGDLNGLRFCARIGIEKAKQDDPLSRDRNKIMAAVTAESRDYIVPGSAPQTQQGFAGQGYAQQSAANNNAAPGGQAGAGQGFTKPAWA